MERYEDRERDDILLYESPSRVTSPVQHAPIPAASPDSELVLYVVSLFGVRNRRGERIDGDALVVRAADQADPALLAGVLGCTEAELPAILDQGGTWAIRQIKSIDGYRLHFAPQ